MQSEGPIFKSSPSRRLAMLVLCSLAALPVAVRAADQAEYAIRWDPSQGGPASLQEAFAVLGLTAGHAQTYVVRYYAVAQPAGAPPGYAAVVRERSSGHDSDVTYKLRGPAPAPAAFVDAWRCPLAGKATKKYEVDVGWAGDAAPLRAYSLSCTAAVPAAQALPTQLGAVAAACTSRMERIHQGDVKAEHWTFADGRQILEVSLGNAKDDEAALQDVRRRIIEPLLLRGVRPLQDSKTGLGSAC